MKTIPLEADDLLQRLLDAADELDAIACAEFAELLREAALCINTLAEMRGVPTSQEIGASRAAE